MKKIIVVVAMFGLSACDSGTPSPSAPPPIKTSYSEIQSKFAENGESAARLYSAQPVELTDTVNSIREGGLVLLVNDHMEAYGVLVSGDSRSALASIKPGDRITVACSHVDSISISQCQVVPVK